MSNAGLIAVVFIALLFYFLPAIIAVERGHHQAGMVVILNTFLGWTLVGWVVSLAIAASAKRTADPAPASEVASNPAATGVLEDRRPCPHCAEPILKAARVCKHCQRDVVPAV